MHGHMYILFFWLLVGRFLLNDDFSLSGNISALIICFFVVYHNRSVFSQITLLITFSILYSSILTTIGMKIHSGFWGAIAAAITMLFTLKSFRDGRKYS